MNLGSRLSGVIAAAILAIGGVAAFGAAGSNAGGTINFLFPNAANLIAGAGVEVDGLNAGTVTDVRLRDGQALVEVDLVNDVRPLTVGTTARIEYRALLGERVLAIVPGNEDAAPLPDGAVVDGNIPRVELDAVLNTLTPEVRRELEGLFQQLGSTLEGSEQDARGTLLHAGPTVHALGQVLTAIGDDGEALEALVAQTAELSSRVADRRTEVRQVVDGLEASFAALADRDAELTAVLDELPSTLDQVGETLGDLDPTVDEVLPVVRDLQPVTRRLPDVADSLAPALVELRPTVAELRAVMPMVDDLLQVVPGLLDDADATLPGADRALEGTLPTVDTLRPYTPEIMGWMTNWAGLWKYYDSNGRFGRVWGNEGPGSFLDSPTAVPAPGMSNHGNRAPGELVGQPWTDATGSPMR